MNGFLYEFFRSCVQAASDLSAFLVGVAAIITSVCAFVGLSAWRRQMVGKEEYDLARRIIRATYKVRDEFINARQPYMSTEEMGETLNKPFDPHNEERQQEAMEAAYRLRMQAIESAIREMAAEVFEAQVQWGAECKDWVAPFSMLYIDLDFAVQELMQLRRKNQLTDEDNEKMQELRSTVYRMRRHEDEMHGKVLEAVENVERKLRPKISPKSQ